MDVIEAIHRRRSIRAYRPEPVARALIEQVIWDAVQAPTPPVSGDTPWVICVIEGVQRLADHGARAKQYAREHQPPGQHWAWAERPDFKVFWDAPVVVLFSGRTGNPEAAFDCCRAGQNLLLAAHARGVGAELGLPAGFDATVAVILGYPNESPAGNPRPHPSIHWCDA
jgi:nitroreductase